MWIRQYSFLNDYPIILSYGYQLTILLLRSKISGWEKIMLLAIIKKLT